MKRIIIFTIAIMVATAASAQKMERVGVYYNDAEELKVNFPENTLTVELTLTEYRFTPGVYARYAQKYLGARASLTEQHQFKIASAAVALTPAATSIESDMPLTVEPNPVLPLNRTSSRALSLEEQAAATADMIFALRKNRTDLLSGEIGENVYGGGLAAALAEIERLEKEYVAMFYGTSTTTTSTRKFVVTPTAEERIVILCRFREDSGILPSSDFSGEAVSLCFAPSEQVSLANLPLASEKSKNKVNYIVAADTECSLLCGTTTLTSIKLPIYQFGRVVTLSVPTVK